MWGPSYETHSRYDGDVHMLIAAIRVELLQCFF